MQNTEPPITHGPAGRVAWDTRRHRRLTAPAASRLPYSIAIATPT